MPQPAEIEKNRTFSRSINLLMDETYVHMLSFETLSEAKAFRDEQLEIAFSQKAVDKAIVSLIVAKVAIDYINGFLQFNSDLN